MDVLLVQTLFFCALLVGQLHLAVCKWRFSLRISSAQCCNSTACDDLFVALCLRDPNHTTENREYCPIFIAGKGNIIDRELTSADIVDGDFLPAPLPYISTLYKGGLQVYIAVLTLPDIPRYNPDDIIDELFIELKSRASGEESQVENVMGERQKVVLSVSLSVECVSEYLGDDCNSHCTDPKCDPVVSPASPSFPTKTTTATVLPSPSSGSLRTTPDKPTEVAIGAGVGGFVVLLVILTAVVVLVLICRIRREKKLPGIVRDQGNEEAQPQFPPTIPPCDDVVDGVSYTKVVHNGSIGYHNVTCRDQFSEEGQSIGYHNVTCRDQFSEEGQAGSGLVYAELDHDTHHTPPPPSNKGLVYADVDDERATYSTFKGNKLPPPPLMTTEVSTEYATIKREPSHRYMNVPRPKPRKNLPRGETNLYSTVPTTT